MPWLGAIGPITANPPAVGAVDLDAASRLLPGYDSHDVGFPLQHGIAHYPTLTVTMQDPRWMQHFWTRLRQGATQNISST